MPRQRSTGERQPTGFRLGQLRAFRAKAFELVERNVAVSIGRRRSLVRASTGWGVACSSDLTASALGDFADPVALTATGHPAGVPASLSAKTVTPVEGTPATIALTIAVGPSVIPQSCTETIAGSSTGLSGGLSHSAQVAVTFAITADALVKIIDQDLANALAAFQYEVQAQIGHQIVSSRTDPVGGNVFSPGPALTADARVLQSTLGP